MSKTITLVVIASLVAGCAAPARQDLGPVSVVASPYEPAAQLDPQGRGSAAEGAVIGAAGGAGIGAMSAKASAGLLCTVGGPLCWVVMIPAAVVGGVIGGLAGGVADAVTSGPSAEVAAARTTITHAVAEMRLTDALASYLRTGRQEGASPYTLEVEVTQLEFLAREKDMAVALHARSRLYRNGELLRERTADARTPYREYEAWAVDRAAPLREEIDAAITRLGRRLSPA